MQASWQTWALLSAVFAALTAILAKVGVDAVHSDFATLVRTLVILALVAGIAVAGGHWRPSVETPPRTYLFLILSGMATGLSWLCYFRALKLGEAAQVAPLDKMSVVMVALFGVIFLGEKLDLRAWLGVGMIAGGALLIAVRR